MLLANPFEEARVQLRQVSVSTFSGKLVKGQVDCIF